MSGSKTTPDCLAMESAASQLLKGWGACAKVGAWLVIGILTGCTSVDSASITAPDVAPPRQLRHDEAVAHFEQQRDSAQIQAALNRLDQNDLHAYQNELEQLLRRNGGHLEARRRLADLLVSQGQLREAESHMRIAHEQQATAEGCFALGLLLDAQGRTEEALDYLHEAASLAPHEQLIREAIAAFEPSTPLSAGASAALPSSSSPAAAAWSPAATPGVNVAEPYSVTHESGHSVGFATGDATPPGRSDEERALRENSEQRVAPASAELDILPTRPADSSFAANPSTLPESPRQSPRDIRLGSTDLASFATTQQGALLLGDGQQLLFEGQWEGAMAVISQAIHCEPQNSNIPHSASLALIRLHRPNEAATILQKEHARYPEDVRLQRLYGVALLESGQAVAAQNIFRQALSLDNTNGLTYFLLAKSLEASGDTDSALQFREQAALLDPRFSSIQ